MFLHRLVNRGTLFRFVAFFLLSIVLLVVVALWQTEDDYHQLEMIKASIEEMSTDCPDIDADLQDMTDRIERAREDFPLVENVPDEINDVFYYTLSFFPELKTTPIEFYFQAVGTTVQVRPAVWSLLHPRDRRTYQVFINSARNFDGVFFNDVPPKGQIGILAHELAHILDYRNKNFFQIIGTGLRFASNKARASYEQSVDLLTIHKGFGEHIYRWTYYLENKSMASDSYKAFKDLIYFSNAKINVLISELEPACR